MSKYLCLNCGAIFSDIPEKSKCYDYTFCPLTSCNYGNVVELDDNMIYIIKELNDKGYETQYCCGGHADEINRGSTIYIKFDVRFCIIDFNKTGRPEGFEVDKEDYTVRYRPKKEISGMDSQIEINNAVNKLATWAKDLPINEDI